MNLSGLEQLLTLSAIPGLLLGIGASIAVVYLIVTGAFRRASTATQDYEGTLVGNVNALKDRVALLERWRDEATALEQRVRDLEATIKQLTEQHTRELNVRDQEVETLRTELAKAKSEMAAAHAKIRRLEKTMAPAESEKVP
jgi:predicted RNase H-like nuclease (RuvC/YqgF family)